VDTDDKSLSALVSTDEFAGLETVVHLAAGGESPMLLSHQEVFHEFMKDKAKGEPARALLEEALVRTTEKCAQLMSVESRDVTFLGSASDGINAVLYGLDWNAGDNVVIADVEFPSGVFPWTGLQQAGVEIRIVKHRQWVVDPADIESMVDERTRIVLVSHVSMSTGQRIDIKRLSEFTRPTQARLVIDATHALGVVTVDAALADVVVSSCYKWLLGVHGAAVFYWNRDTFPELQVPFLGWNSVSKSGGWQQPLEFALKEGTHRFQPGNPCFLGLYLLENALDRLLVLGKDNIEQHALGLSGQLHSAVSGLGYDVMTPAATSERAGNICIASDRIVEIADSLAGQGVLVWGTYASAERLRISTHVYNSSADIDSCVSALAGLA